MGGKSLFNGSGGNPEIRGDHLWDFSNHCYWINLLDDAEECQGCFGMFQALTHFSSCHYDH